MGQKGNQEFGEIVPWHALLNHSQNEVSIKSRGFKLFLFPLFPNYPSYVEILLTPFLMEV